MLSESRVIPVSQVFGHEGTLGKVDTKTLHHLNHTRKVIQSPQLHVSHQIRLHSCVKTLRKLIYVCFTGAWALGQFGETEPKQLKACEAKHWKQSNAFRSTFQIKIGFILESSKAFRELSYIYLFHSCFGIRTIWGN